MTSEGVFGVGDEIEPRREVTVYGLRTRYPTWQGTGCVCPDGYLGVVGVPAQVGRPYEQER